MAYKYQVSPGQALNIWKIDEVSAKSFESPVATFDPDDRFRKIGVEAIDMKTIAEILYPVREAFLKEDFISEAGYTERQFDQLYFPWANRKVDFSSFSHEPQVLSVYGRTFFTCEKSCEIELTLKTCGGIKLWHNGEEILIYKSYERNVPNSRKLVLQATAGDNELLIYANDLAERDVFFYFELVNESTMTLDCHVPISQSQNDIDRAKAIISSVYFEKDTYLGEPVKLNYDPSLIDGTKTLLWGRDKVAVELVSERNHVVIGDAGNPVDSYFAKTKSDYFPVQMDVDGLVIGTRLYLATYNKRLSNLEPAIDIHGRKRQSLEVTVSEANKGDIGTALALLASKGVCSDLCREIIEIHLKRIEDRLDCADFRLAVILLIVERYGDLLPQVLKARIKTAVLNFRYWCDEPGNDVMWFFSENHALLFHVAQYLTGHLYPEEIFVSGKTSLEQKQVGYDRIVRWFEEFLPVGFGEWNSLTYLPVDCIAFFTLYEIAPDKEITALAREGLDYIFEIIAENLHHKIFASSYGRTYEHTLKGLELGELAMYAWIAWGQGTLNVKNHATSLFAVSDYEPLDHLEKRDMSEGKSHTFTRIQGSHNARTYIHKRAEYSLASAWDFHPFETGLQQHFINLSFSKYEIPIWFNHPGEKVFSGHNRPSYWAGWQTIPLVKQEKNLLLAGVKMKNTDEVDYIHANIPLKQLDTYEECGKWFLFCKEEAYGAFWFANGYELIGKGANKDKEIISYGRENGIAIRCGSMKEDVDYESFKEQILSTKPVFNGAKDFSIHDWVHGSFCL